MNNKEIAEALRAIDLDALPIKDRAAVLNAAEALEIGGNSGPAEDGIDVKELNRLRSFVSEMTGPTHPGRVGWLKFIDAAIAHASKEGEA